MFWKWRVKLRILPATVQFLQGGSFSEAPVVTYGYGLWPKFRGHRRIVESRRIFDRENSKAIGPNAVRGIMRTWNKKGKEFVSDTYCRIALKFASLIN